MSQPSVVEGIAVASILQIEEIVEAANTYKEICGQNHVEEVVALAKKIAVHEWTLWTKIGALVVTEGVEYAQAYVATLSNIS